MTQNWTHFKVDANAPDRTTIWIDVAERSMNVLSEAVFDELENVLDQLVVERSHVPVLFRSAKPKGFIVGADLKRIAQIHADEQIQDFMLRGQRALQQMETSPLETIALLNGPCLGGGLEWALACDYRIACVSEQTQIGMPESKLGLIPGWGGTVRLRETIGTEKALEMLLTGESVGAEVAYTIGLVDRLCDEANCEEVIADFIAHPTKARHPVQSSGDLNEVLQTAMQRWGNSESLAHATLLRVIESGMRISREAGFEAERTSFFALLNSPLAQENLSRFTKPKEPRVS